MEKGQRIYSTPNITMLYKQQEFKEKRVETDRKLLELMDSRPRLFEKRQIS